jgi:hypothetical protein
MKAKPRTKGVNHSEKTCASPKNILAEPHALKGKPTTEGAGRSFQQIEVVDLKENTTTSYDSICAAARALGISGHRSIHYSLKTGKAYKKRYTLTKL